MDAAMKVSKLNKKAEELTLHIDQKIKDLRSHYSPADLTVFDNAIEARNKLFDQLEIESKKFAKEQEQEAEDFEIELQNKLDDMDKTLLWDIEKAENEYKQAEIESGKRLANAFVDIKSTSILSQLLQKRASLKDHKASLPKDEFERALPKYYYELRAKDEDWCINIMPLPDGYRACALQPSGNGRYESGNIF